MSFCTTRAFAVASLLLLASGAKPQDPKRCYEEISLRASPDVIHSCPARICGESARNQEEHVMAGGAIPDPSGLPAVNGTTDNPCAVGVLGRNKNGGIAAVGTSDGVGLGFLGGKDPQFHGHAGVYGQSDAQGVMGLTTIPKGTGVYGGGTTAANGGQIGVRGETATGVGVEPGTVVVLNQHGLVRPGDQPYDKKVAGVVSGAGDCRPAIVLDKGPSRANWLHVALMGKVCCKVDARYSPIKVGDLLTTSPTPGHAMKAADPIKAFGSVIGKALHPLEAGQGVIPILIALQ
jgi:hypothetical protein